MATESVPSPVPASLRRERMRRVIAERGFMSVSELSHQFDVSDVTVRNDLEMLDARGVIRRIRGGALPRSAPHPERPFEQTAAEASEAKAAIGRAAAALVESGETVILDVGTTTAAVARALVDRNDFNDVVVITNGLNIALALEAAIPRLAVLVSGGTLRPLQHSLVDPLARRMFEDLHADLVFLGCNGVDVEGGITNVNLPEVEVKQRMLQAASRRVVVADSSKLARIALARVCAVEDIDLLITDADADPEFLAALPDLGVDARVADKAP